MSIADKITRLQTAKSNIASAITTKGGTVTNGDGFEDFATDIATIPTGGATLQSKTLTLGASAPSSVSPDSGYDGLSSVPVTIDSTVIKAENIAQGTTILGIAGTHSGGQEPAKGFVPTAWDSDGWITEGKLVGMTTLPTGFFGAGQVSSSSEMFGLSYHLVALDILCDVTAINNYAFCKLEFLTSVTFQNQNVLTSIGSNVFQGCTSLALTTLPSGVTNIGNYAFHGCTILALTSLPSGVISIGSYAFQGCRNIALTSLPSGVTSIRNYTFQGCTSLALTTLSSGITSIGNSAFQGCTGLTSITFEGTPSGSISSTAFNGCTNLTTINVPWSEGAKTNAPWGATNATINYNYTGV